MNDTRDPAKNGQEDIDEEVRIAAGLEEDGERGQEEGQEVEAHVRGSRRHFEKEGWLACALVVDV